MKRLRYYLKRLLSQFGVELRRIPKPDQSDVPTWLRHPITAEYLPNYRGSLIVKAQLKDARGLHVVGFPFSDAHPFVRAAKAGLAATDTAAIQSAIRKVLVDYYTKNCPNDALEAVQLTISDAPGLANFSPHACLLPWSSRTVHETVRGREIAMTAAGMQYGLTLSIEDGLTAFGPATDAKLDLETRRISNLVHSVKENGFTQFDPRHPLKAQCLLSNGQTRWLIEEGHHRLPLAAALNIDTLPIMVGQVVRREDASHWPRVADGTFGPAGALKMFDRLFG